MDKEAALYFPALLTSPHSVPQYREGGGTRFSSTQV